MSIRYPLQILVDNLHLKFKTIFCHDKAKTPEFTGTPGVIRTRDPQLRSTISPIFHFFRFQESSKIKGSRNRIFHFSINWRHFSANPPIAPQKRLAAKDLNLHERVYVSFLIQYLKRIDKNDEGRLIFRISFLYYTAPQMKNHPET